MSGRRSTPRTARVGPYFEPEVYRCPSCGRERLIDKASGTCRECARTAASARSEAERQALADHREFISFLREKEAAERAEWKREEAERRARLAEIGRRIAAKRRKRLAAQQRERRKITRQIEACPTCHGRQVVRGERRLLRREWVECPDCLHLATALRELDHH